VKVRVSLENGGDDSSERGLDGWKDVNSVKLELECF
jgi:hypothetical protein